MASDAQIVKGALGPFFISVFVSWILRVSVYAVTRDTLNEHGHAAELSTLMMTADALGAPLPLMSELAIRIQVRFVMPVAEKNDAAGSLEVELDDSRSRVVGLDPVAINLIERCGEQARRRDRELSRRQSRRHCSEE
jgi:hypothetical protein